METVDYPVAPRHNVRYACTKNTLMDFKRINYHRYKKIYFDFLNVFLLDLIFNQKSAQFYSAVPHNFFSVRVYPAWNAIPKCLVNSLSLSVFNFELIKLKLSKFVNRLHDY